MSDFDNACGGVLCGLRGGRVPIYTSLIMDARFLLLALFLLLNYSLGAFPAWAVKRPGAARPLRIETPSLNSTFASMGNWMFGTAPKAMGKELWFSREDSENGERRQERAERVVSGDGKIVWAFSTRGNGSAPSEYSVSPDGRRVAFASLRSGLESIYVRSAKSGDDSARRLATLASTPVWLDANTLIFQSTRPGRGGIYKINLADAEKNQLPTPTLWFAKSGEAAVSPDGETVCIAARDERLNNTQLYLLAKDGSGARVVPQTLGARRPCFSPDGDAIFYDAPAPREDGSQSTPAQSRVIWTVPFISAPPAAQLTAVRESKSGELEVLGTAFSEAGVALKVEVELSAGDLADDPHAQEAARWKKLNPRPAPIHGGVLSSLRPVGLDEHSTWTLRLTVTDADGDRAQSTLPFSWPLETAGTREVNAPLFPVQPERYGLGSDALESTPTQSAPVQAAPVQTAAPVRDVLPVNHVAPSTLPAPAPKPVASPRASTPVAAPVVAAPPMVGSWLPGPAPTAAQNSIAAPLPKRSPAPSAMPKATPKFASKVAPKNNAVNSAPKVAQAKANAARPRIAAAPRRPSTPPRLAQANRASEHVKPRIEANAQVQANNAPPEAVRLAQNSEKRPGGIPSRMKVGSTVPVTVVLRNTGSRSWSSQGESPVRLIYRWVDVKTNVRHRWAVKWLRETVPPGESTELKFDIAAPTRAGEFILTYALVRLNPQVHDGKKYTPPPAKTNDHRWPGEFGAVSFRVQAVP